MTYIMWHNDVNTHVRVNDQNNTQFLSPPQWLGQLHPLKYPFFLCAIVIALCTFLTLPLNAWICFKISSFLQIETLGCLPAFNLLRLHMHTIMHITTPTLTNYDLHRARCHYSKYMAI